MSWQLFWFLHTCVICIYVQLILEQRYNFFMNEQKGGAFFIVQGNIWIWSIINLRYYEFPDSAIHPFSLLVCKGSTDFIWKLKGRAASRFGPNLPSLKSIHSENLSPFNVCTQKCRRQRKWATDENVDKQTDSIQKGSYSDNPFVCCSCIYP